MKRPSVVFVLFSMLVTVCILLTSCNVLFTTSDTGALTTKNFEFADFNTVDIGSNFTVDIGYSDTYSVQITARENLFKNINVTKIGNTLKLGLKWPNISFGGRSNDLRAKITMPELVKLTLSGATEGKVNGFNSTNDFDARLSGASELELEMETERFNSVISGSSEMTAKVKSSYMEIKLSGSSDLNLDSTTGNFILRSSGASNTGGSVQATSTSLHLSGSSSVELTGSGGDIDLYGSGASSFKLEEYKIEDVFIELSGASDAFLDINGVIQGSLSGSSELNYEGNPILGDRLDIRGGAKIVHR
jgi:hypothetical protein